MTARGRARRGLAAAALALVAPARASEALPPDFVDAAATVPGLSVEMRYAGAHNFVGARIAGYEAPRCLLTRAAAQALARVQADLRRDGLGLKVYDCYRPRRAVAHFVRWSKGEGPETGKAEFYPDLDRGTLFAKGYIAERSGHSRGSTVDLTLVTADGAEVDMGGGFDLFGPRSACCRAGDASAATRNRLRLRAAMERRGFAPYDTEWWHFSLRGEPYPDTYFDAPIR